VAVLSTRIVHSSAVDEIGEEAGNEAKRCMESLGSWAIWASGDPGAVVGIHCGVAIAMENDGRHGRFATAAAAPPADRPAT
jgi:hypothetical protein